MSEFATDHVRAFIAKARVAEMKGRGWRVIGPGEEGSLLMEGPQLGGAPVRMASLVNDLFDDMIARALERADRMDAAIARAA
ncbi:hypothetical protein [Azospirillum rugosum]|uniref:Uncharacterized protein n=1 Tax=Azospirillum rugosum TaxID=416170 RepID=A0ABS4SNV5_9PROT|nr:hypothetical protein [Azospirillum rugosum]MBP2294242.1 hypothetical protein [Azospirillum rugosum]MDQ0527369.1 hypothetical protein [Azospirillum rugosum]